MLKIQKRTKETLASETRKEKLLHRDQRLLQSRWIKKLKEIHTKWNEAVFEREWPRKRTSQNVSRSLSKNWREYQWSVCLWECLVRVCIQTSWFKFLHFLSHTGVSQVTANLHMLMNWSIAVMEHTLNGFIEISFFSFFLHKMLLDLNTI